MTTLTIIVCEGQESRIVGDGEVWTTPAHIVDEDGTTVDTIDGPVSEDWLPAEWDALLRDAGYRRTSEWDLTEYAATVERDYAAIARRIAEDANGWYGSGQSGKLAYRPSDGSGGQWWSEEAILPQGLFIVHLCDLPVTVPQVEYSLRWASGQDAQGAPVVDDECE
jgi:hypothetical protein